MPQLYFCFLCPHRQWANSRLGELFFLSYLNKTQLCLDKFNTGKKKLHVCKANITLYSVSSTINKENLASIHTNFTLLCAKYCIQGTCDWKIGIGPMVLENKSTIPKGYRQMGYRQLVIRKVYLNFQFR